jgi:hypothetical protein
MGTITVNIALEPAVAQRLHEQAILRGAPIGQLIAEAIADIARRERKTHARTLSDKTAG